MLSFFRGQPISGCRPYFLPHAPGSWYSFSFGGVKTDTDGRVVDAVDDPICGLWAIPGTAGGMQYDTYIGVISTMTAMGHKAGTLAAQNALVAALAAGSAHRPVPPRP